jgi:hypothetical protein
MKTLDPVWIRIGIQPKMLDPDPDSYQVNLKPCFFLLGLVFWSDLKLDPELTPELIWFRQIV